MRADPIVTVGGMTMDRSMPPMCQAMLALLFCVVVWQPVAAEPAQETATKQWQLGLLFEKVGRLDEAEAAYLKATESADQQLRAEAMNAVARIVQLRADAAASGSLELGALLEDAGRFEEAAAAYGKALAHARSEVRTKALERLKSLAARREGLGAGAQLLLGDAYRDDDQLTAAQSAYSKAYEGGDGSTRVSALQQLRKVSQRREGTLRKYVLPAWENSLTAFFTALVSGAVVTGAFLVGRRPIGWIGRRRGRHMLAIDAFGDPGHPLPGSRFADTLIAVHGKMTLHFKSRTLRGTAAMPPLLNSQSADVVELLSAVTPSAVPLVNWFTRTARQAEYRISGLAETSTTSVKVWVSLERAGSPVAIWSKVYNIANWFTDEQDLAYEIMIRLKEVADATSA